MLSHWKQLIRICLIFKLRNLCNIKTSLLKFFIKPQNNNYEKHLLYVSVAMTKEFITLYRKISLQPYYNFICQEIIC